MEFNLNPTVRIPHESQVQKEPRRLVLKIGACLPRADRVVAFLVQHHIPLHPQPPPEPNSLEKTRPDPSREREMAIAIAVKALPLSFVVHLLAIAGAVLVLVWNIHFRGGLAWESTDKSLIFNLHPVLMLIGLIIIGGEAIISYKALPFKKEEKKIIHLVLHAIALILGIIGVYAAFKYHNESSIANLYSLHSWLGIGVISLYGIQWLYGFVAFFYPGGSAAIRRESLPWHVLFGIFVYILAVATATLGFLEKLTFLENSGLAKYGSEAFLVNFTAIVTILYGTFVLLTALSQGPVEDDYSYSAI